ncbi:alpha/beta hydrolase fold domain-containing protein [Pararhodobacter sp.]|uniref:alpha/beta hydrolase fold domain-containing protein n=1 Tax=Pararhodobacter sp. TaxID=2127056 RepID=UPI002AFF2E12|nr:alpha/beta hydrolase fold domain-containing protein [Pararhodobacter sp.]
MTWQARAINQLCRLTIRRAFARQSDPVATRRAINRLSRLGAWSPPLSLSQEGRIGGVSGLWISNQRQNDTVVLYFHGGAYLFGSPETHETMLAALAQRTRGWVFAPRYRLAPEHPFPAAFDDAVAAWDGLLARGYDPRDIVIGGDSAGGGLALALLSHLLNRGQSPAGLFAYSPWTDLTLSGASLVTNAAREHILAANRFTEVRRLILGGARPQDAADPRLSPIHASFPAPPPIQIHVAESEVLRDDSLRMRSRVPEAEIKLAGDLPHVWTLLHNLMPEARATLDETAAFIRSCAHQPSGEN